MAFEGKDSPSETEQGRANAHSRRAVAGAEAGSSPAHQQHGLACLRNPPAAQTQGR